MSNEWQPGILALADRTDLQARVEAAGFASTTLESIDMVWTFANPNEYWTFLEEVTALGPVLRALSDVARDAVRAALDTRLSAFTGASGILLPAQCWGGLAIR
jgi:hypothetical protein